MDTDRIHYYEQESDDLSNALDYIEAIEDATKTYKKSLRTKRNAMLIEEEEDDVAIDKIIQSVFTENQTRTFSKENQTLSKKNGKLNRNDVRSVFKSEPMKASFNGRLSNNIYENFGTRDTLSSQDTDEKDYSPQMRTKKAQKSNGTSSSDKSSNKLPRAPGLHIVSLSGSGIIHPGIDGVSRYSHIVEVGNKHNSKAKKSAITKKLSASNETLSTVMLSERAKPPFQYLETTRIEHLGKDDLTLLKVFAETELRTIFRENGNIKFNKMATKRKPRDNGMFGVSLEFLLSRDSRKVPSIRVPFIVQLILSRLERYVDEEGLLRVSGSQARIKETVNTLEYCSNPLPLIYPLMPHDLAGLLKHFLRTLPQPLFSLKWLDAFCKALNIEKEKVKLKAFQCLMCLLPDANRATLQLLVDLLLKIINSKVNRMTLENVAMMISPSLFSLGASNDIKNFGQFTNVVLYVLENNNEIWNVPMLCLEQIREVGIQSVLRAKKNKKKAPENTPKQIYVHSMHPDFPQRCLLPIETCTVAEILEIYNSSGIQNFVEHACLFENGGILDQRLLLPQERIKAILLQNANARFSISLQSPKSLVTHFIPEFYD